MEVDTGKIVIIESALGALRAASLQPPAPALCLCLDKMDVKYTLFCGVPSILCRGQLHNNRNLPIFDSFNNRLTTFVLFSSIELLSSITSSIIRMASMKSS